jgi:hypothetical protein
MGWDGIVVWDIDTLLSPLVHHLIFWPRIGKAVWLKVKSPLLFSLHTAYQERLGGLD